MTDRIDRIVDSASAHTKTLLQTNVSQWPVAREGLERILAKLHRSAPDHPGLQRLRRLIDDLSLICGDDGARD